MQTFILSGRGRQLSAIGEFYQVFLTVRAKNKKEARLKSYEEIDWYMGPEKIEVKK
tara:strand:+ start:304 stop:471 length:168 start_codon:yes stop_codon:yes gene_type:complete